MDPFILDTEDLSTIRGGGLLLLDAIHRIATDHFAPDDVVSTGASVGLFRYRGDEEAAEKLVATIREFLDKHFQYRHATILVEWLSATPGQFVRDRERLLARIRRAQLAAPGLAVPTASNGEVQGRDEAGQATSWAVCTIDQVRPVVGNPWRIKGKVQALSAATRERRQYGVTAKTQFYTGVLARDLPEDGAETPDLTGVRFAAHFQDIAGSTAWGPLNDKMAVLYLDGNDFSGVQRRMVARAIGDHQGADADAEAIDAQKSFDRTLKRMRAEFLRDLLSSVLAPGATAWRVQTGGARTGAELDEDEEERGPVGSVRLETLLWGGDEIILVVPAWQGWDVARMFLDRSVDWTIGGDSLHHALGLVFCNHKAPIHRVTALARALADHAKEAVGRDRSSLAYQVLESFDHIGTGVEAHFARLCPPRANPCGLILTREGVAALSDHLPDLKKEGGLPQRQLKRLARALFVEKPTAAEGQDEEASSEVATSIDAWLTRVEDILGKIEMDTASEGHVLEKALSSLGDGYPEGRGEENDALLAWYHVDQLWDYVHPEPRAIREIRS